MYAKKLILLQHINKKKLLCKFQQLKKKKMYVTRYIDLFQQNVLTKDI